MARQFALQFLCSLMTYFTKNKAFIISIILFLQIGCKITFTKTSAIPPNEISVSDELIYIVETDQMDRKQIRSRIILGSKNKYVKLWMQRDSIRITRVHQLYTLNKLVSGRDKFNAGLIFFHRNPLYDKNDCYYLSIANKLFDTLRFEKDSSLIMNGINWSKMTQSEMKHCE